MSQLTHISTDVSAHKEHVKSTHEMMYLFPCTLLVMRYKFIQRILVLLAVMYIITHNYVCSNELQHVAHMPKGDFTIA